MGDKRPEQFVDFDPKYPPGHPDHYVNPGDEELCGALADFYNEEPLRPASAAESDTARTRGNSLVSMLGQVDSGQVEVPEVDDMPPPFMGGPNVSTH